MSAMTAPATSGAHPGTSPQTSFRQLLDARRAEGKRLTLDDAIAIMVPVCVDAKALHDAGQRLYLHPSAIMRGPDGLMHLNPALATAPTDPRDKATIAPELVKAGAPGDARASVFAVGAILYEAVTGSSIGPALRRPRDVDPSLPEAIEVLLGKALVADPTHRPDDLGALASAMHHMAPMKSIHPPDVDESKLDGADVDVKLSLLPPVDIVMSVPPGPQSAPMAVAPISQAQVGAAAALAAAPAAAARVDPTRQLASLKARLEADPRPRYVVNKQRMDHGPFNAVELLQQIASHQFEGGDILRDEMTGGSKTIDEWDEFAPFAEHARRHREIIHEKKEVAKVEVAEKKAGFAKVAIGAALAITILGIGGAFVAKKVGERKDGSDLTDDPSAVDLSGGGALKGGKKAGPAGGKGGVGGGGNFPAGMSYEAAIASNNQEISMGGPKGGPDLSDAQLNAPMRNASFISGCGAPDSMKVTVKVAVKMGRAVGVSVYTNPSNGGVASCIDRAVRGLSWPANPKMDSFTTSY